MRRVVYGEEREEERYVIRSITFQDQVSVSFNRLNQRRSLKEFRTECIKAHCIPLSNQLYCIVEGLLQWKRRRRGMRRSWGVEGQGEGQ